MARIRSIKQDFFLNEDLATVSSDARLLAIGLSTIADKCGRLEDRPLKIKAQLFPYHGVDITKLLDELDQGGIGFIQRYSIDGKQYIQITNFEKHQKPHPKEPESSIPAMGAVKDPGSAVEIHGNGAMHDTSAVKSREDEECTETNTEGSSGRNGSGNGSGNGNGGLGSLGSGDGSGGSAKAGASAADEPERDHVSFAIWDLGVNTLKSKGMSESSARSFMGLQCKTYGAEAVSEAVTKMLAHGPVDPRGYLIRLLQDSQKSPPGRASRVDESLGAVRRVLAQKEAQRGTAGGPVGP